MLKQVHTNSTFICLKNIPTDNKLNIVNGIAKQICRLYDWLITK